ncbi:DUF5655 domain-containing protein [Pedobacter nototheniae]|uniref:DUF5655 domain-containing protein n=1 Tax=Pedobacter nototheniae TaxID=2488994 RepID=UPI00103A809A|nr:DUF5655 domain-containing protein [Pedobacter nototheniae]
MSEKIELSGLLNGKTEYALSLFRFFIDEFEKIGKINLRHTKTMIAIEGDYKMAYLTQVGKNFIHVVFQFDKLYEDNLCFIKIGQVPNSNQFNHHLRIYFKEDINDEVKKFMKIAYRV